MQYIMIIFALLFSTVHLFSTVGGLDDSFGTGGIVTTDIGSSTTDAAYGCAMQPDGKIIVVGSVDGSMAIARYTVVGGLDSEFGGTGKVTQAIGTVAIAYGVAIQNDGKIVVCGTSDDNFFVARFLADGSLDTAGFNASTGYIIQPSLGASSVDAAYAIALNPVNQKIIVTGSTDSKMFVAQYTTSGALDTTSFNAGGTGGYNIQAIGGTTISYAIALDANYNIVVTGVSDADIFVARFLGNGTLDTAGFNASNGYIVQSLGGTDSAYGIGFQSTGKIIVCGTDGTNGAVARFNTDGTLDTTSFGVGLSGYNVANTFGGTSAIAYSLAIQADDKIVIGGTVTNTDSDFVIARYLADGSGLDSSFGVSTGYTVTDISGSGSSDAARAIVMQSNNRFVLAGTTDSGSGDFAVVRYLGNNAQQGCINVSYDESTLGAQDGGYVTYPTDGTSSHKPQVKSLQVLSSNSVFVLTEDLATTPQSQLVQLDAAGVVNIDPIDIAQTGGADVIVDSHGRALVVGGNGSRGWLARYVPTAGTPGSFAFDSSFNGGNILIDNRAVSLARVCEQASGTILGMGQCNGGADGIIVAYNQDGTVNTSFGNGSGYYQINNLIMTDMVVDAADNIYVIGSIGGGNIELYQILPDGLNLNLNYNFGDGFINTGFASASYQGAKLAGINSLGYTTLITVENSTGNFYMQQYDDSGSLANGTSSVPQSTTLLNSPVITQMQVDSNDELLFVGYDNNYFFVGKLLDDISDLDITFAPNGSPQGLLKTKYDDVNPTRVANSIGISPSGAIVFGGYENIDGSNTVSVVGNVVGVDSVYELVRYPGAQIGQVDISFGTEGILTVPGALPSDAGMQLYVLTNNKILVTYASGSDTILEQLNSDYTTDTGFGSTGIRTLTGMASPQDIMVDQSGNIYVVGNDDASSPTQMILCKISSSGTLLWTNSSSSLQMGNVVLQQVSGRIVVAGKTNSSGAIAGFNQNTGAVDIDFSSDGYYTTGVNHQIIGAAITSSDKIVYTYMNGSNQAVLQQIYSNGSGLDSGFGTGSQTLIGSVAADYQIRLQLDRNGKIIIVAMNGSKNYIARRYTAGGNNDVGPVTIVPTSINNPYLQDILSLSDGSTLVLGIDDTGTTLEMFRLTSAFAQDPNFNYSGSGFLETGISGMTDSMSMFNSLDVISDQGILVVGKASASGGAFNRIYNDSLVTKVNQNQSSPSNLDPLFGPGGFATLSLSSSDELNAVAIQADGKIVVGGYTTIANYSQFFVARYNADGTLDTAGFNAGGTPGYIITAQGLYSQVNALAIQADGKIVAGGITENDYMLVRYNSDGTLDTAGFGTGGIVTGLFGTLTSSRIYSLVIQPEDQYIVVGGEGYDGDLSISEFLVARFNTTGTLDTGAFNSPNGFVVSPILASEAAGGSFINSIALQTDGKIVVGGASRATDVDAYQFAVARYTTAGVLDTGTFNNPDGYVTTSIGGYDDQITAIAIDPSSQNIFVGGFSADDVDMIAYSFGLASYSSTGSLLHTAGTSINGYYDVINAMAVQADGKILVAGNSQVSSDSGPYEFVVARYLSADLSLDTSDSFGNGDGYVVTAINGVDDTINAMALQSDGKIVVAGFSQVGTFDGPYEFVVARYMDGGQVGSLDTTFNPTGTNPGFLNMSTELTTDLTSATSVKAVLQLTDGSYYVAADNGASNTYITYFSSDDVQQTGSFGSSGVVTMIGKGNVSDMLLTQSGKLLVVGGDGTGWIKQYNATTGALDTSFAATTVLDKMLTVQQQSDGRIIVAGGLGGVGTLIAYNSVTGAIDTTFGVNGYYTATGFYPINGLVVDTHDYVYWMANRVSDDSGVIKKLSSTGSVVVWTGASTIANDTDIESNHLALDQNGNVVAVGIDIGPLNIVVKRYLATNGTTLATGTISSSDIGFSGVTPHAISMQIDATSPLGNIIITGYAETDPVSPFVIRVLADLSGLDTSFNGSGVQAIEVPSSTEGVWYDAIINQEGKILVGGYAKISSNKPYLMQLYGDSFVGQYLPTISAGTQGTIDTNFGTSGYVALGGLGAGTPLAGATPLVVLPLSSGYYYMVFDNGKLARFTNANILDTTFNAAATTNIQGLAVNDVPAGASSMIIDGAGRLVVAGTDGSGHGWIQRYVAGDTGLVDTVANGGIGFNTTGSIDFGASTIATTVIEQTLGRYVVASQLASGNGALLAFTNLGETDTTFHNPSATPGIFDTQIAAGVYGLIADVYDRLILAIADTGSSAVYVGRLTSAGQNDTTFGNSSIGSFNTINGGAGILQNADIEEQVRLAFDSSGNIVIAAHQHTSIDTIAVVAYDNNTGSATPVYGQYDISDLTSPTLTDLITTTDGKVLLSGNQSAGGSGTDVDMWVARVTVNAGNYELDTSFNPGGADIAQGIMNFNFYSGSNPRVLSSIAIYGDGQIIMAGSEDVAGVEPFVAMAYDNPYTVQIAFCQDSQPVGANDTTLGASSTTATNLGVTFFASSGADATSGQVARAIDLQDDANIVVAVDGGASSGSATPSQIFLKMFTIDGTPQTTFGTAGQRTVLTSYAQQFVNDMVTFTTAANVHKAILAGYVSSASPALTGSLVLQYDLDNHTIDSSFGGLHGNVPGSAVGDAQQINCVGLQSTGRIIASGLDLNNQGVILGYTTAGKLDSSFGNGGGYFTSTEMAPIYTHAIDSQNRIIIAYEDQFTQANIVRCLADGSNYDSSFNSGGLVNTLITTYGNNGMKVAVDSSDNVIIAVGSDDYTYFTVQSYSGVNGALNNQFSSDGLISLTHFVLTKLLIDIDGRAIVIGYDTNTHEIVIARLTSSLDLDTSNFDAPSGYLAYAVAGGSSQVVTDALIHPDGRVIIVGSES